MKSLLLAICGMAISASAFATDCKPIVYVNFIEGAPKDQVLIRHDSLPEWHLITLTWVLDGSNGDLIFDTVRGGAGFDVAQPFEGNGTAKLAKTPIVSDGDRTLSLVFGAFPASSGYRFTLDVDDRISGNRGTMISGAEIAGARVLVIMVDPGGREYPLAGAFDENAKAVLASQCRN